MMVSVKDVRKNYLLWVQRNEMLEEACCTSNIGYPGATAEQRAVEGALTASKGCGGSRVPSHSLDAVRGLERQIEDIGYVMRRMPAEFMEVLRRDYAGEVDRGKDRRHREAMCLVATFWSGCCAGKGEKTAYG